MAVGLQSLPHKTVLLKVQAVNRKQTLKRSPDPSHLGCHRIFDRLLMQGITDAAHLTFGLDQQAEHPCQEGEAPNWSPRCGQIATTRQTPFSRPQALDGAAGHQDAAAAGEQGVNA